jgi:hypothetical protein
VKEGGDAPFRQKSLGTGVFSIECVLYVPRITHLSIKSHSGIAPDPSFQPRVGSPVSPRMDTYPKGHVDFVDAQHPAVLDDHPVVPSQVCISKYCKHWQQLTKPHRLSY